MKEPRTDPQEEFAALLEESYDYTQPQRGDIRKGIILSIGKQDILLDLGLKRDGVALRQDLDLLDEEYRSGLKVGDEVPVCIIDPADEEKGLVVSLNRGLAQRDWQRAEELLADGQTGQAKVIDVNRGGVLVAFGRIRGFVPNSHLSSVPAGLRGERLQEAKNDLVGETLSLAILEVNRDRKRLILSERAANQAQRRELLKSLEEGDVCKGTVRNLADYGAFVDLGGLDGLIHISELAWQHIDHPRDVLNVGNKVDVCVLSVDRERERVELSRKKMLPDPWPKVTKTMKKGQIIEGTVTKVVDFGAFVDVGKGVEGLVHISEMPNGKMTCVNLDSNSTIRVRVLNVDAERRRIALSLMQVEDSQIEKRPEAPSGKLSRKRENVK
jgi:small subunit ribosomal protein S1